CVGFTKYFQPTSFLTTAGKSGKPGISLTSRRIPFGERLCVCLLLANTPERLFLPTRTMVSYVATLSAGPPSVRLGVRMRWGRLLFATTEPTPERRACTG